MAKSIQVTTFFFAMLIGFSLQDLLNIKSSDPQLNSQSLILCIVSIFLFLRFLLGCESHLSIEYAKPAINVHNLIVDLSCITAFGILAICICHPPRIGFFFCFNGLYLVLAILWGFLAAATRKLVTEKWVNWLAINFVALAPLLIVGLAYEKCETTIPYVGWRVSLVLLALCYAVALYFDFRVQLAALAEHQQAQTAGSCPTADTASVARH